LKQLSLGILNYATARKTLPAGKMSTASAACGPTDYSNWAIDILPFVEEKALYEQYRFDVPNSHADNAAVVRQILSVMNCPSDPNGARRGTPIAGPAGPFAVGSYKGVSGRGWHPMAGNSAFFDSTNAANGDLSLRDRGPLFVVVTNRVNCAASMMNRSPIKPAQITDGTSKTLLVGEYTTTSTLERSAFWADSYYAMNLASVTLPPDCKTNPNCNAGAYNTSLDPDYDKCAAVGTKHVCARTFTGIHGGGGAINFAYCDGSVRRVMNTIDMRTLAALATVAGEEQVRYE
jgi:prepilin-type processing-associated H-X9-DG protein